MSGRCCSTWGWNRTLVGAAALLVTAVAHAGEPSTAGETEPCTGDDEITLKNGGMLRGKIVALEPEAQAVIVVCGEKRTISWSDIDAVERGKHGAPDSPPPPPEKPEEPTGKPAPKGGLATAAPEETSKPPPPPGPGVVRIHIVADDPLIQLYRVGGSQIQVAGNTVHLGTVTELICQAPCDTIVDGRDGASFFFSGQGIPPSDPFQLLEHEGDQAIAVDAGSAGPALGGALMMTFGILGVIAGGIMTGASFGVNEADTGEALHIAAGTTLGGGAALIAGGAVLVAGAGTKHEFLTPEQTHGAATSGLTTVVRF